MGVRGMLCCGVCRRQAGWLLVCQCQWYQLGSSLLAPVFQEGSNLPTPFPSPTAGVWQGFGGTCGLLPGSSGAAAFAMAVLGFFSARKACWDSVPPHQAPGWLLYVPNAWEPDLGWSWDALHCPVPPFPGTHSMGGRWGPCSCGWGQDLGGERGVLEAI